MGGNEKEEVIVPQRSVWEPETKASKRGESGCQEGEKQEEGTATTAALQQVVIVTAWYMLVE